MEQDMNYLFGMHSVLEAINSGKHIDKVILRQGLEGEQFRMLTEILNEKGINFQFVPVEKLNNITKGRHQGVVAFISQIDYVPVEEIIVSALNGKGIPLIILLDGVSDVRNFGAIARSAECSGAAGIVLPAKGGAAVNADAVKSSAGALLRIPTARVPNLRVAIYLLKESGFNIVGADEKGEKLIYEIDFKKPTAIVLGSENKGISDSVSELLDEKGKIPLLGSIGSLNVSVAASVIMFEAVRQRSV